MNPKRDHVTHAFVEFLPQPLEEGVVYISLPYKTMAHLCCCGCGSKVVTPLSPTGWQLTYDGKSISITPSIGSWNLDCQSHYWISRGQVFWARRWSRRMIDAGFERDRVEKENYYRDDVHAPESDDADPDEGRDVPPTEEPPRQPTTEIGRKPRE